MKTKYISGPDNLPTAVAYQIDRANGFTVIGTADSRVDGDPRLSARIRAIFLCRELWTPTGRKEP